MTRTSVQIDNMFSNSTRIMQDYTWLEGHIGGLLPVETVVSLPAAGQDSPGQLERLRLLEDLRTFIAARPEVTAAIAASLFFPKPPQDSGMRAVAERRVLGLKFAEQRPTLRSARLLSAEQPTATKPPLENSISPQQERDLWRITARLPALQGISHAGFLQSFQTDIEQYLANHPLAADMNPKVTVCGGVFQVAQAQEQLLLDMRNSLLTAFGLIALAMGLVTRSWRIGLITMLPNTFPMVLVFGVMGCCGWAIDIGAMMTAGVALGIAVDDTSHFFWWFRRARKRNLPLDAAIQLAFHHCASAMLQTSLICGAGLLVFAFSPFLPVARFGLLMSSLLAAALLGDLVIFPAILKSPLAKFARL